jgi:alpha-ribazole phosphatase
MQRAVQTAAPIAKHYGIPFHKDARITEINLGTFNGKGWDSTIPAFGLNSSQLLSTCEYDFTPYGGENADETRARVVRFIDDVKQKLVRGHLLLATVA